MMLVEVQAAVEQGGGGVDIDALYDQTLPHLYGYLLVRVGGDVATAEDLTQEVYLALAQQLRIGDALPAPLPRLYRVARHRVVNLAPPGSPGDLRFGGGRSLRRRSDCHE